MKILHICLCGPFTDGFSYQENEIVEQHMMLGNEVSVIASTLTYGKNMQPTEVDAGISKIRCGATLIRLPYSLGMKGWLPSKIRSFSGLKNLLNEIAPDRILFHGLTSWSLLVVSKYVQRNPHVILYADSHEDSNNSARNFLSKWILHYLFYRTILRFSLRNIIRVLSCSIESMDFIKKMYGVPDDKIEYFPLGGVIWSDADYFNVRDKIRSSYGWSCEHKIYIQSGKFDGAKRLSHSLRAFAKLDDINLRFVIVGQIMPDIRNEVLPLIMADSRVEYLGWIDSKSLRDLLCAADIYIQPGSQSATMQMALCCRRPVIIADVKSHWTFIHGNGFLVSDDQQLYQAMSTMASYSNEHLSSMSRKSADIAAYLLDYRKQALRLMKPS